MKLENLSLKNFTLSLQKNFLQETVIIQRNLKKIRFMFASKQINRKNN